MLELTSGDLRLLRRMGVAVEERRESFAVREQDYLTPVMLGAGLGFVMALLWDKPAKAASGPRR
jgi:hypothetical protein